MKPKKILAVLAAIGWLAAVPAVYHWSQIYAEIWWGSEAAACYAFMVTGLTTMLVGHAALMEIID